MIINSNTVGIIADDLTGANDTALQFELNGADTNILLNNEIQKTQTNPSQAWAISTESRNVSPQDAFEKVKNAAQLFVNEINPDYIIVTHYQILDMIPKSFLKRTIYEHHSSLKMALDNPANKKTLYKYNNIVRYVWLTKKTMENAEKIGLKRNMYIYNPVKFNCSSQANVIKNKKIIVISRLSAEKRITLMIDIVKKVFTDVKYKDWTFEIY